MSKEQPKQTEFTVRMLPEEEFFRLEIIFAASGGVMPDSRGSRIAVAEDADGNIVGMFVLQVVAHGEPIWVSDDYRKTGVGAALVEKINEQGVGYYSFSESERVSEMCRANGMQELPYRVFFKKVE